MENKNHIFTFDRRYNASEESCVTFATKEVIEERLETYFGDICITEIDDRFLKLENIYKTLDDSQKKCYDSIKTFFMAQIYLLNTKIAIKYDLGVPKRNSSQDVYDKWIEDIWQASSFEENYLHFKITRCGIEACEEYIASGIVPDYRTSVYGVVHQKEINELKELKEKINGLDNLTQNLHRSLNDMKFEVKETRYEGFEPSIKRYGADPYDIYGMIIKGRY